jgi:UrcA family protein
MKTPTKFRPVPRLGRIAKTLILSGAMALAAHGTSAAVAESAPQVTVRYDDLNLSSAYGIEILKRRIRHAAEVVCGGADAREVNSTMQHLKCVRDAADSALARVNWRAN